MENILQNLKHEVTCTICHETFRAPKTLPCLHTFCCECLNELLGYRSRQNLPLDCPICAAEIRVPNDKTFDSLPTSFYHNRLLETLAIKQCNAGSDVTCGNCKKLTSESSYCFECAKFLCSDCLNAHNLLGYLNENHRVVAVREFRPQDYEALLQRQPFCQQQYHEREALRYFCTECEKCICQVCLLIEHNGHKAEHLQKAAEDQKQVIVSTLEKAETKAEKYKKTVEETERISGELEENVKTARRELRATVEKLKNAIDEIERDTVGKLVNIQHMRQERMNEIKENANTDLKLLKESIEYVKNMKNEGMSAEILQMKDCLQQRFQELLREERDGNRVRADDSFIKFLPDKNVEPLKLGRLQTSVVEPSLSLIATAQLLNVQASDEVKLDVVTKGPDGEVCYDPETQINVVIEPRGDVVELNTNDKCDGEYQVSFRPQVPGKYTVHVKIENEHIQNSPHTVDVKPRELVQVASVALKTPGSGKVVKPSGVAVSADGEIAVVDKNNGRVLMYSKEGEFLRGFGQHGSRRGELDNATGVTFTSKGELLIGDQSNHRVQKFDSKTGQVVSCFGKHGKSNGEFTHPNGVSVDSDGRIIVCDFGNHRVQVFDGSNRFLFKFGDTGDEKLYKPYCCVFHNDMFFVTDSGHNCIKVFDKNGEFLYKFGRSGTKDGELSCPYGLCVHGFDTLIVCNRRNSGGNCIQMFTLDGRFVRKSVQLISGSWEAAALPDGTIVVSACDEGYIYLLK